MVSLQKYVRFDRRRPARAYQEVNLEGNRGAGGGENGLGARDRAYYGLIRDVIWVF